MQYLIRVKYGDKFEIFKLVDVDNFGIINTTTNMLIDHGLTEEQAREHILRLREGLEKTIKITRPYFWVNAGK